MRLLLLQIILVTLESVLRHDGVGTIELGFMKREEGLGEGIGSV